MSLSRIKENSTCSENQWNSLDNKFQPNWPPPLAFAKITFLIPLDTDNMPDEPTTVADFFLAFLWYMKTSFLYLYSMWKWQLTKMNGCPWNGTSGNVSWSGSTSATGLLSTSGSDLQWTSGFDFRPFFPFLFWLFSLFLRKWRLQKMVLFFLSSFENSGM